MGSVKQFDIQQRMLDAAICAYSVDHDEKFNPDCQYLDPIEIVTGSIETFISPKPYIDAGFVAVTKDDWAVLSFRGTLSHFDSWDTFKSFLDDWLQDAESRMVPFNIDNVPGHTAPVYVGRVEHGFHKALMMLWPQIKSSLDKLDWSKLQGLQITGHSKGAAMTFLAAAMAKLLYPQARKIEVNAFAAPLAGDPDFASWYKSQHLDLSTTRIQRIYDIVPFLPPEKDWDIFDEFGWPKSIEGAALEATLKALGLTVHGGYQAVGSLVFLPGQPPSTSLPITGPRAIQAARSAILHAIEFGLADDIASAHSAVCSYWPAVFQEPNKDPTCKKKTVV